MKKLSLYFIIGLAATAFIACDREKDALTPDPKDQEEEVVVDNKVPMVFSAVIEETKSNISGKYVVWENGDKIAIFDGSDINEFIAGNVSADGVSADFSGSAASVATYYAVAPKAAATNLSTENTRISIKIPGSQTVKEGRCVDPAGLVSTAVSSGTTDLHFVNQFSLMKVTLTRSDVASVMLIGNNDESISGTNHFYYGGEGAPYVNLTNAGGKDVTLTYEDSSGNPAAFPAGDYYISIWPTTFSAGYKLILTLSDGSKTLLNTGDAVVFPRNGGSDLKNIDNISTFCPATIMTAAQLKMWRRLAEAGAYAEGDEVKLGADINLGGYAWTPIYEYLGIFNGQNHKIYNFTISSTADKVGFIGTLGSSNAEEAQLKDVVFGSSNGTSYDGTSSIEITGARSGWTYGGIVGYAHKKTTISGVTNFIPVSAAASVTGKHAIGGISGSGDGGSGNGITITECHNYGAITDNSTHATVTEENLSAIGGILGATNGSYTVVSNCVNHAAIQNNCIGVSRLGGIVGKAWDGNCTFENCSNEGNITNNAASITDVEGDWDHTVGVGGICGAFTSSKSGLLINKCSNSGTLTMAASPNASYYVAYGGIIGNATYGGSIKGCTNTGKITESATCGAKFCAGGIIGLIYTKNLVVTKADDNTYNTNSGEIWHLKNHSSDNYFGGIVGFMNANALVEYCINNARIVSDAPSSGDAVQTSNDKFSFGGICGAATGKIKNCTNNGYIFAWSSAINVYIGGICGGGYKANSCKPAQILDSTNNGWLGPHQVKGSSAIGGILSEFSPANTEVRRCTNTGRITTGRFYLKNDPAIQTITSYQEKDFFMGGLFGRVLAVSSDVTDNVTDCIVACTISNKSAGKYDDYSGIIAGEYLGTSSNSKMVFGTSANPIMIVNTCSFEFSSASGSNETLTTTAIANKWLVGSHSSLYDATNGSSNTSKLDFNYTLVTPAQAGIE